MPLTYSLEKIASQIQAELRGDPQCLIDRAEPLADAGVGAITFLANPRYRAFLLETRASAVILRAEDAEKCPVNSLVTENPELAFSRLLHLLYPAPRVEASVHPTVVIGKNCELDPTAVIGAYCVIADGVKMGAHTIVDSGCVIGANSRIGAHCRLYNRVTLYHDVNIGDRTMIHSGAVIGADGFGLAHDGRQWVKTPQIGGVTIGNDVEIGANTTIDRGALQNTVIEDGVKIDNLVQVAHNVKIGAHTAIAGCVAIAGSTRIGRHCMIGGSAMISGHIDIADGVILTGSAAVGQSINEPGVYSSGVGVQKNSVWRRNMLRFHQLDDLAKRLRRLEKQFENGEEARDGTNEY
jgi:UDP-3-O-[3-hydroxymyristoyl] glucosamine N-acyltransferase